MSGKSTGGAGVHVKRRGDQVSECVNVCVLCVAQKNEKDFANIPDWW